MINRLILNSMGLCLLFSFISPNKTMAGMELGATLGTPAGLNLNLGYWSPFVIRASGGYLSPTVRGAQAEIGWGFDLEGMLWQYISIGAQSFQAGGIKWAGVGPFYGFNLMGFSLQAGLSGGSGSINGVSATSPQLMFQIGYTYLFGR